MIRMLVLQILFAIFTPDNQVVIERFTSNMTLTINRTNLRVKYHPILITFSPLLL